MTEAKGLNFSYLTSESQRPKRNVNLNLQDIQRPVQHQTKPYEPPESREAAPSIRATSNERAYISEPAAHSTLSSGAGASEKANYCIEALQRMKRKFGGNLSPQR